MTAPKTATRLRVVWYSPHDFCPELGWEPGRLNALDRLVGAKGLEGERLAASGQADADLEVCRIRGEEGLEMADGCREDSLGFLLRADLTGDLPPSEEGVRQLKLRRRIIGLLIGEEFVVGKRDLEEFMPQGLHSGLIEEIILADLRVGAEGWRA
jgi:hypothetical protein